MIMCEWVSLQINAGEWMATFASDWWVKLSMVVPTMVLRLAHAWSGDQSWRWCWFLYSLLVEKNRLSTDTGNNFQSNSWLKIVSTYVPQIYCLLLTPSKPKAKWIVHSYWLILKPSHTHELRLVTLIMFKQDCHIVLFHWGLLMYTASQCYIGICEWKSHN